MSDVEYTNNELLNMIKKLQLRVDKLEKGEGKTKKKSFAIHQNQRSDSLCKLEA